MVSKGGGDPQPLHAGKVHHHTWRASTASAIESNRVAVSFGVVGADTKVSRDAAALVRMEPVHATTAARLSDRHTSDTTATQRHS